MVQVINQADLPADVVTASGDRIFAMIAGANAKATRVAPCLAGTGDDAPTDDQLAESKLILIGAISRWSQAGSGAYQQQTAGPFGVTMDTRQRTGYNLWPSEISDLQDICSAGLSDRAFEIDTAPAGSGTGYWSAPDAWTPIYDESTS